MTRVCVIGAGSSGIAVVKALKDASIDFDCFELCGVVGGNWAFGSPWSAAYRTLHINSYCREMEYADFPMPANVSDYPHHEEIAAYFNAYVDHFGLRPLITFDTSVERATPKPGRGWGVQLSTGEVRDYDYLIVATGHHNTPRWPEPPFSGHFDGVEMHSHDYRDMSQLTGKNVVVLGMGNSAMDIAVESSYVARHTYLASRRGAYVIPKYFFGRPGLRIPPWLPWQVRQFVLQQAVRVTVGPVERYGLQRPSHRILQAHPTVSDGLLSRLAHGAIVPKPNIAELCGHEVRFADGSLAPADLIVYCTGYRIRFPFFDEAVLYPEDNELRLYARIFPPRRRTWPWLVTSSHGARSCRRPKPRPRWSPTCSRVTMRCPGRRRCAVRWRQTGGPQSAATSRPSVTPSRSTCLSTFGRYVVSTRAAENEQREAEMPDRPKMHSLRC